MSRVTLNQRIHTSTGNFAELKAEIDSYGLDTDIPANYHIMKDHWLRELNKRAFILGQTGQMVDPYDGGLRPITPTFALSGDSILLIDGENMVLIDNNDMVLI